MEKNYNTGGIRLPAFGTYSIVTVIKSVCYWQRERHIDQWDRTENPETDPHKYTQMQKSSHGGKRGFSTNGAGVIDILDRKNNLN